MYILHIYMIYMHIIIGERNSGFFSMEIMSLNVACILYRITRAQGKYKYMYVQCI